MLQLLRQATAHPLLELTRQQRQLVGPKQADEMTAVRGVVSQPALDHCGREAEFQALLPLLPAHLPAPLFEAFLQLPIPQRKTVREVILAFVKAYPAQS